MLNLCYKYTLGSFRFYLPNAVMNIVFIPRTPYVFILRNKIDTITIRVASCFIYYFRLVCCRGSGKTPAGLSTEPRAGAEHRSQLLSDHLPGTNQTS